LLRLQVQALAAFGDLPLNVDLIVLQQLQHSPAHDIMQVRHCAPHSIPFRGSLSLATQPLNALFAARRSKGIFGDDDDNWNSDDKLKNDTNYMLFRIVTIRRTTTSTLATMIIMTISIIDTNHNQNQNNSHNRNLNHNHPNNNNYDHKKI
jgi:hypothetical protein